MMNCVFPCKPIRLMAAILPVTATFALATLDLPLRHDPESLANRIGNTYRMVDGVTAYIVNPEGKAFDVTLDVRDLNLFESGPREVLFKVYGPDGTTLVREVIPDDGIASRSYLPRFGGWDHEMWYYGLNWTSGSEPMLRWSATSEPARLGAIPVRTFVRSMPAGKPGIYRVMAVGARDHYVSLTTSPDLPRAVNGHPTWLHGHGDQFRKSYIYVPRGVNGLNLGFIEYDPPQTRQFTLTAPDGNVLFDGAASGGFTQTSVRFDAPGQYDDQLLVLDVSEGSGDFMIHILLNTPGRNFGEHARPQRGGGGGSAAVLAPTPELAKAVRGGSIEHDGQVFWHHFQIKLHDWLKARDAEAFIVHTPDGEVAEPVYGVRYRGRSHLKGLPLKEGFVPLNGVHEPPPLSDGIMFDYPLYKPNAAALNIAIRDVYDGLRYIGTGDHRFATGWNGNFGYIFATYGFHYWRPAWRMMHEPDVPDEVKEILREALLVMGDRLAFGRNIERSNGNALSHIPIALRYCAAATEDPLQQQLFETYFARWSTGGWGAGAGISRSGTSQEHFAHDYHYGTYILANLRGVLSDFDDPGFRRVQERLLAFYGYVWAPEVSPNVWSSRTALNVEKQAPWQGEGGPDMTVSVNDGDEWFAARRAGYYIVTFHGRLAPMWLNNYFNSRMGYGGGGLTQMAVPGKGPVLVASLNGNYGEGMQPANWRNFRIHSVVGEMADGLPLVAADSEHLDAHLEGHEVASSGEVRDCPVRSSRRYRFEPDGVAVHVALDRSGYHDVMWGMGRKPLIKEAYEMIPFIPFRHGANPRRLGPDDQTLLTIRDSAGASVELTEALVATEAVTVDRGGFGVIITFDTPRPVKRGANNTVLIELVNPETSQPVEAARIALHYRLIPFGDGE